MGEVRRTAPYGTECVPREEDVLQIETDVFR